MSMPFLLHYELIENKKQISHEDLRFSEIIRTFNDFYIKNFIYTKITQFGQIKGLDFFQKHYP